VIVLHRIIGKCACLVMVVIVLHRIIGKCACLVNSVMARLPYFWLRVTSVVCSDGCIVPAVLFLIVGGSCAIPFQGHSQGHHKT